MESENALCCGAFHEQSSPDILGLPAVIMECLDEWRF